MPKISKTKQHVLATARQLFNEAGTAPVSTNHIAEAAGISPGNLYYHYDSKEDIIRHIADEMFGEWDDVWLRFRQKGPSRPALEQSLAESFTLTWEYRFFFRELSSLLLRDPALAARYQIVQGTRLSEQKEIVEWFDSQSQLTTLATPAAIDALLTAIWIVSEYWVPYLESTGEETTLEQVQAGKNIVMGLLSPYIKQEERGDDT